MKSIKRLSLWLSIFVITFVLNSQADDLSTMSLDFCTTTSDGALNMTVDPGVQTGICYKLSNGWKNEVTVKVWFVDGTFTNDEWKNPACYTDDQTKFFGQYVTGYQQIINLKPGQSIDENAMLKYPKGMNGIFHGCLTYSIVTPVKDKASGATSFSIQMRRAKFIDVISGNPDELMKWNTIILEEFTDADGENLSNNPKIRIYKDLDDSYIVALKVKNIWVFDENVNLTGVASNLFTYKEVFNAPRLLTPWQSLLVTQKLSGKPNYNLSVKLAIGHTPNVFGDVKAVSGEFKESATLWIWNIVTVLTLVGILIVGWIIFLLVKDLNSKSKKKK